VGLLPFACWDCGFQSRRENRCLSIVSVVCCQVEVSASSRSLVQRSPIECGVSARNREASIMRRPWHTRGHFITEEKTLDPLWCTGRVCEPWKSCYSTIMVISHYDFGNEHINDCNRSKTSTVALPTNKCGFTVLAHTCIGTHISRSACSKYLK